MTSAATAQAMASQPLLIPVTFAATPQEIATAEAQAEVLQTLGCERAQGYLFAEPLTAEEAALLVRTYNPETLLRRAGGGAARA